MAFLHPDTWYRALEALDPYKQAYEVSIGSSKDV
jgi:hypothetical protein